MGKRYKNKRHSHIVVTVVSECYFRLANIKKHAWIYVDQAGEVCCRTKTEFAEQFVPLA